METDIEIINKVKKGNTEAYGIIVKKIYEESIFYGSGFCGGILMMLWIYLKQLLLKPIGHFLSLTREKLFYLGFIPF